MPDEAASLSVAVSDSRPTGAPDYNAAGAPARELAQRRSGEVDVLLLWHPDLDRVELCVLDLTTGVSVHIDVDPEKALDAFNHPYAYVTRRTPGDSDQPPREAGRKGS